MIENPSCPVCDGHSWRELGRQSYAKGETGLPDGVAQRYRILFETWAPGTERFVARYVLCAGCGLVIYAPRPTAEEVAAKYAALGGASSTTVHNPTVTTTDRTRSAELFAAVADRVAGRAVRVLDFGGGTGSLMVRFVEAGLQCSVVDYAPETIAGVEKLATTIAEVPAERRFDLVIASHVLEHVTDPVAVVRELAGRLSRQGTLYVELPLELAGRIPRRREPLTHINFFAEPSTRALLERAGLVVDACWTEAVTHAGGTYSLSVRAIAHAPSDDGEASAIATAWPDAAREVEALIRMPLAGRIAFGLQHPKLLVNPLRRVVRR
ncbi:MAG: class I SAM-dependent methyltransferase [Myxococcales bacterium]|nr:class I SAM-dependent methyltransferase [Myxococcales bacterium]MCB9521483.1 class I SAM-dependent methyltransferase [Myxococcales bacterium]MCB9531765.1 class I SAM-dependent methyltransferase [Myxococcales bacterium]